MFEGLVRQLLLGYLGRYIKDFQTEQLKITLWNEEVLLENVELILEAFDYLQLPVALNRGHIGRLSIRIPWKKLGWDPIIILLEDVFFSTGPRDDEEWSADAVEKRELASKKAKLAAAELAKLSNRVSDNQAGQSLISHVTGRILDSIQVSMRNVHILYYETKPHSMQFGLRFSSLMIARNNFTGPSNSKVKGGQVNKTVEIQGLGIYCNTFRGSLDLMVPNGETPHQVDSLHTDEDKCDYIVVPFDLTLLVTKCGKVEHDAPQYSVTAELTKLVMTLNPVQLQHILNFSDYICTCQLREKYGRYRPWGSPLSKKAKGWQKQWWQYAQESVISDVRKRLKKTSWRYLGPRLDHRRKYVNLYKVKLNFLRREQPVDQDVLLELEHIEKDSDIDDILQFRLIAEQELEDSLCSLSSEGMEIISAGGEKLQNDEVSSGRARGWLNWLSRGVLGAGGTDDSSQFSGVVSDEVIKDICEATKFQPMPSTNFAAAGALLLFAVNFHINEMSLLMKSESSGKGIASISCRAVQIECKVLEDSTSLTAKVSYAEVVNSSRQVAILQMKKTYPDDNEMVADIPSASFEIDASTKNEMAELVLKVTVQPVEIYFNSEFLLHLMEFYSAVGSHKSLQQRVLVSLNGVEDVKSRLLYKTECVLSQRQRIIWDVNFVSITLCFPWDNVNSEQCSVVLQTGVLQLSTKLDMTSVAPESQVMSNIKSLQVGGDILTSRQLNDVYDHYELSMNDCQITLVMPRFPQGLSILEKSSASVSLALCIIPDELVFKQFEAHVCMSSFHVNFSYSIFGALMSLVEHIHFLFSDSGQLRMKQALSPMTPSYPTAAYCFSVALTFELFELAVNFEDDGDTSTVLLIILQRLHLIFAQDRVQNCQVSVGLVNISSFRQTDENMREILCSSKECDDRSLQHLCAERSQGVCNGEQNKSLDRCIVLHYGDHKSKHMIRHFCKVHLSGITIHCYPSMVQLLAGFFKKLMVYEGFGAHDNSSGQMDLKKMGVPSFCLKSFGLSNFCENSSNEWMSIPRDQFPFINMHNSGWLRSLGNSILMPEWRSFNAGDFNARSPNNSNVPNSYSVELPDAGNCFLVGSSVDSSVMEVELDIADVSLHFHDSSCIVGSINVPVGKASVSSHTNCFDVLCSLKGLSLFSSQWTYKLQESLWGASLPNQSPVLNIRARKGTGSLSNSDLEISFGVQHVCCVLPPDYLAILIGYFSLPDWNFNDNKHQCNENSEHIVPEKHGCIIYKFEILESVIISPVESNDKLFLKLDLHHLYGSFIDNDVLESASIDVLTKFAIAEDKVAIIAQSLNIFGRNLCLSLLFLKDCSSTSIFDQGAAYESCTLVQSMSFDMWLRFQGQSQSSPEGLLCPLYVLIQIASCEFCVEETTFLSGIEALMEVVDEYSLIEKKSRCYTTDIFGFLQLAKSLKNCTDCIPSESNNWVTEVRCFVNHMFVKFCCPGRDSDSQGLVARMGVCFKLSATLEDDSNIMLNSHFSSLFLSSSLRSTYLANFQSDSSASSVLDIHLSITHGNEIELQMDHFSLVLWFHFFDWLLLIDQINSCILQVPRRSVLVGPKSTVEPGGISAQSSSQCQPVSPSYESDQTESGSVALTVKSKNVGITCHIPFEGSSVQGGLDTKNINLLSGEESCKVLIVSLHSRSTELYTRGNYVKLKINFEKATGSVGISESSAVREWPFFQLYQLGAEIQICDTGKIPMGFNVDICCETLDFWFSHQVFYFSNGIKFPGAQPDTSEIALGNFDMNIKSKKVSILLTDGRSSCNGPLIEFLMGNLRIEAGLMDKCIRLCFAGDLLINYHNIQKVLWEPFVETWSFKVEFVRKSHESALLDSGIITDLVLESVSQLNVNITKSFCEALFRTFEMLKEARGLLQIYEDPRSELQNHELVENLYLRRYASYAIYNRASLPFVCQVYQGFGNAENIDISALVYENTVLPGSSVPIYIDGMLEDQSFNSRPASFEGFGKKLSNKAGHYFMTIQFEGTSHISEPISMDRVGLKCFEVNFSRDSKGADADSGLLVPVVFDVSMKRYSKLIQLYSTVIFHNLTSVPLQLRFDIPFSMSSKVVGPIHPGEEFPLPLHLAEAGHMRWRPLGSNYLWSEVHNLSKILSSESRSGFLRSLVCYPSHPSSYLFRCCLSVQDIDLPLSGRHKRSSPNVHGSLKQSTETGHQERSFSRSTTRFIHNVALVTPLTVKNYLPRGISATIEGGGVIHTASVIEGEVYFFHVDSSHDLTMTFHITGFRPSAVKFPRAESFSAAAKPSGTLLSLTETMAFSADSSDGPVFVTVEKIMDSLSGARELCISVPFLLYNCTGFPLTISRADHELKGNYCIIPTSYSTEQGVFLDQKDGLHVISSDNKPYPRALNLGSGSYVSKSHITSPNEICNPRGTFLTQSSVRHGSSLSGLQSLNKLDMAPQEASLNSLEGQSNSHHHSDFVTSNVLDNENRKAKPFMYSPDASALASETMVRVSMCLTDCPNGNLPASWSSPFFLVAPSGSITVLIPQPHTSSAAVISVTSHLLGSPLTGRTRAITFQPRYVISNACGKALCYKQKGTNFVHHLGVGQHSHLHWIDTTRELLVSVRFDEPGCQWSGSFLPDRLGDTQVKMRNYASGAVDIIRVEVQNADVVQDEKINSKGITKSGTNFIIISDDDTGFVPYRVDNFSKETLRIYQQKCETLVTTVHPYTSCPYSWDEPFFPHRLIVEVPGARIVGSYPLDDIKEYAPVHLSASSMLLEKHERTLLSSVHAEGAMKVLSIIDSSCHAWGDLKTSSSIFFREKRDASAGNVHLFQYKDKISMKISFIGISIIDSSPQELIYVSGKDITVDWVQDMEQQRFSFQISSLQVDNQLRGTPYPVVLSFDEDYQGRFVSHMRMKDGGTKTKNESLVSYDSGSSSEPVICLTASKWRNKETTLVSFEHTNLRMGDLQLELDLELLLKLLDFFKANPFLNSDMAASVFKMDNMQKPSVPDMSHSFTSPNTDLFQANGDYRLPKIVSFSSDLRNSTTSLLEVSPIGAPWQKIFLLARRQTKIYMESLSVSPFKVTLSFSSNPWMLKNGGLSSAESFIQRGIMAFADVEGAQINFSELTITHHMASWDSIQEIFIKHYTRRFLHEMYKVFGSAGVIGNPMGFARRVGLGVKDFLSVPAKGVLQSPFGLISGMAQGTTSLLSNTMYAISDTATQFSKAAHKGVLAFTFDDHDATKPEQRMAAYSQSKGVINELLEGLTGLLQSPIKGAEKHGLPGVLSGFAFGVSGLVAKPAASVLEATGRTAQSIRNRSKLHRMGAKQLRVRLPRSLSAELPLRPYSWEDAVGAAVLLEVDDGSKFRNEVLVMCKSLKDGGKFVILTEKLIMIVECPSLVDMGKPNFRGVVAEPVWIVLVEISLESVIHVDIDDGILHIVGSSSETPLGQHQHHLRRPQQRMTRWSGTPTPLPLFQTNLELASSKDADYFLRVVLSTIEQGRERGWGNVHILHKSNLK